MVFNKPFGRYTLVKKIAMGGMAEVFLAIRRGRAPFRRLVALKCILDHVNDDPAHVGMFYNEAKVGGLFRHANLIHVFDAEQIGGRHTMVMEFVPGQTVEALQKRLVQRGRSLDADYAVSIVSSAALGLHHAHTIEDLDGEPLRLVHRDVSPANVMVGHDGTVKAFDFGVAAASSSDSPTGDLAGKTAYMSPEQCRGRAIDARSDVFALGVVLWELLTGERLFQRENHIKTIRAITEEPIRPPSEVKASIPKDLDAIVVKALDRKPDNRHSSALELHADLLRFAANNDMIAEEEDLAGLMRDLFSNEIAEIDAVVQKVLMAPEHSDATIDLSTFDIRASRAHDSVTDANDAISAGSGGGLAQLAEVGIRDSGAVPVLAPQANDAILAQLQKAKATNRMLVIVAAIFGVLAAIAFVIGSVSGGDGTSTAPAGSASEDTATSGAVAVESTPAGATILVGGEERGTTPAELLLPAGEPVDIRVEMQGYLATTETVTPAADAPAVMRAVLEIDQDSEFAPIGSVRVSFTPSDAQVFMAGELVGSGSPVLIEGLTLDTEHTLRISADGYETLYHPFRLDSREILEVQLALAEAVDLAVWNITSTPAGAIAYIDGEELGPTPIEGLELVANQAYTLELQRSGYQRWRQQRQATAGDPEDITATLQAIQRSTPTPAPEPTPAADPTPAAEPTPTPEPTPEPEEEDDGHRYQLLD